jgi:hypothetical protein
MCAHVLCCVSCFNSIRLFVFFARQMRGPDNGFAIEEGLEYVASFIYLFGRLLHLLYPKCTTLASFFSDLTGAGVYDSIHKVLMNKLVETNMAFSRCPKCDVIIEQIIDPMTLSGYDDDDIDEEGSSTFDGEVCSPSSIPPHAVKHRDE